LWNLAEFRFHESLREKIEQIRSEAEAAADGFGQLTYGFGANGVEIDEPGVEDRSRDVL
jgi:hypothetical protein